MKILLITSSFPRSGIPGGLFIPDTVRILEKMGADVQVLTQNCFSRESHSEKFNSMFDVTYFGWSGGDIPLVSLFSEKKLTGIFLAFEYFINGFREGRRICREWKPDIIHAEWLIPAGLLARMLSFSTGIPYSCRALGSDVYQAAQNPLFRPVIKNIAKNSSLLFADGFDLCERTSALAGGKECHFAATARIITENNPVFSFGDDSGRFVFCCIGRLHPVKGQDILIRACDILKRRGLPFRCYLAGSGQEKANLEGLISRYSLQNDIILTGNLGGADIMRLLQKSDLAVIPSRSESIPMVLMEALTAGKPLIVTDAGDMGLLARKYNLGYVVASEDYEKLADSLISMSDPNTRKSFYSREKFEELASLLSVESGAKIIYEKIKDSVRKK